MRWGNKVAMSIVRVAEEEKLYYFLIRDDVVVQRIRESGEEFDLGGDAARQRCYR